MRESRISEGGVILPIFLLGVVLLIGVASITLDAGNAYREQRKLHASLDAASLAAAMTLNNTISDLEVRDEALLIASENNVDSSEVKQVICGEWASDAFTPCGTSCDGGPCPCADCSQANAVMLSGQRQVNTTLAGILGFDSLNASAFSVAMSTNTGVGLCIHPFGIEMNFLDGIDIDSDPFFTLRSNGQGNWGKLDIVPGCNPSGSPCFEEAMVDGTCNESVMPGATVPVAPGAAGMRDVFQTLLDPGTELVIASTSEFPPGRSAPVTLGEFAKIKLLGSSRNGNNWSADFELLEYPYSPNTGGSGGTVLEVRLVQ